MKYLIQLGPLVILLVLMYFVLIRPQKKKEKEVASMRSSLNVGDEIVTIGGICGKIVKTKEDTIVIQVGADKLKFEMMRWSVSKVVSSRKKLAKDDVEEEEPEKKTLPKRMKKVETPATETEATEAPAEEAEAETNTDEKSE